MSTWSKYACRSIKPLAKTPKSRLLQNRQNNSSVDQVLFEKTLTLYRSYRMHGCLAPPDEGVTSAEDIDLEDKWATPSGEGSTGVTTRRSLARVHLSLTTITQAKPFCGKPNLFTDSLCAKLICSCSCKHHSLQLGGTRDHLFTYEVGNGQYDTEYLEALFNGDVDEIECVEATARTGGYGPLAPCSTISNYNSVKVNCRASSIFFQFFFCF